jgi:hypothetical protein
VTTIVGALEAVERGEAFALRVCVDALAKALAVLREPTAETSSDGDEGARTKVTTTKR